MVDIIVGTGKDERMVWQGRDVKGFKHFQEREGGCS